MCAAKIPGQRVESSRPEDSPPSSGLADTTDRMIKFPESPVVHVNRLTDRLTGLTDRVERIDRMGIENAKMRLSRWTKGRSVRADPPTEE